LGAPLGRTRRMVVQLASFSSCLPACIHPPEAGPVDGHTRNSVHREYDPLYGRRDCPANRAMSLWFLARRERARETATMADEGKSTSYEDPHPTLPNGHERCGTRWGTVRAPE